MFTTSRYKCKYFCTSFEPYNLYNLVPHELYDRPCHQLFVIIFRNFWKPIECKILIKLSLYNSIQCILKPLKRFCKSLFWLHLTIKKMWLIWMVKIVMQNALTLSWLVGLLHFTFNQSTTLLLHGTGRIYNGLQSIQYVGT